ncbi:MAG: hypothetical protein JWP58_607 [Hymenobacter sp.]|nr:hypothetical protein [Hymenobacter sp.]
MQHNLPFTGASQSSLAGNRAPVASRSWRPVVAALGLLSISMGASAQNRAFPLPQMAEKVARPLSAAPAVAQPTARPVAAHKVLSAISSTATGGNWSAPATWVGGVVPTAADDVTIVAGATVTLDVAATAASLTVAATGSLLTSATTAYQLQVAGSVTNNGTLDLSASSTIGSDLRFTGAGNAAFTGTGTTDLQTVSLAKSVRADIVEMNLPTLSVKGSTTSGDGFLSTRITTNTVDDMTGTLKISGTATISNKVFSNAASYVIPATGGFWLNNANFTVANQTGSPIVNGSLRISTGTYNVGSSIGNSINFGTGSVYTQEGGTLSTVGRFTSFTSATAAVAMTFTMSGGILNVSTVGNTSGTPSFGINGTNTVSGGTINLVQRSTAATPLDYYVAGTYAYTGGTVNIGTAATATNFDFRVRGTFPNLTVDNTTNPKSAVMQGQTNVYGTALITPGATLNLNGFILLQVGAAIANNGTLTGTTAGSTVYFAGSVPQTLGGTGTFSVIRTITVDNNGGGATLSVPVVTTRVNLFTGNLNGTSNLTIGDGTAIFFVIQIGVTANTNTSGSFASAPTFNLGSGALQVIYAPELTARTTGFEIPATRTVDVVTISNPAGVVLAGGNLLVNGVSNASLLLSAGILTTTAANTVVIGPLAGAFPTGLATSYVKGPLGITVNSATAVARTFAVGDAAGWRPVVVTGITASTDQTFTATVVSGATGGQVSGGLSSLNPTRYVRLQNTANLPATARVQLSYGADDVVGGAATAVVAQAPTAAGTYASIGGAAATVPTTGLVSTLDLTPGNDFFVLANTEGGTLTTSAVAVCAGTNSGTITLANNVGTIVKYQADNGSGFVDVTGTNTGSTYAFSNLTATTTFRAVILTADNRTVFSAPVTVTVTPATTATFAYSGATFCATGTNPTPTVTGTAGGTFSSTTGLSINATTGAINLSASTAGTYTVTYTVAGTCGSSATASVTITAGQAATFSYGTTSTYCVSGTTAPAVALGTGASAGTFSSTTGLTLNATTGAITLSSSTPGTYTVTNTVAAAGGCAAATATTTVTITAAPVATFSYATTSACAGSATLLPATLGTGASAGTFSSTTGLTLNATTGAVNPATSTAGTYTVTNTVAAAGGCAAATSTATVTINALPVTPTFSYTYPTPSTVLFTSSVAPAGTTYQWYVGTTLIVGATSQTYTANGATAPGTYTVRFVSTATGCQSAASASLVVTSSVKPLAGTSLSVYPNPTHDGNLKVELTGYRAVTELTVLNALGQVVFAATVPASNGTTTQAVNLTQLSTGIYILRVKTEGGLDTRRVVKE